ncbi:MAG: hypothetical protein ACLSA2_05675 [Candidatus Gastranaerophilaceae bacterium]
MQKKLQSFIACSKIPMSVFDENFAETNLKAVFRLTALKRSDITGINLVSELERCLLMFGKH